MISRTSGKDRKLSTINASYAIPNKEGFVSFFFQSFQKAKILIPHLPQVFTWFKSGQYMYFCMKWKNSISMAKVSNIYILCIGNMAN